MTKHSLTCTVWTACIAVIATAAPAATHYVDPAGSNTPPYLTPGTAAHLIQDAINVSIPFDDIAIAAATYAETGIHVTVSDLVIDGAGIGLTIIDGGGGGVAMYPDADNITISDLTIQNCSQGMRFEMGGGPTISTTLLERVDMRDHSSRGIEIHNNTTVADLTIDDCDFENVNTALRVSSSGVLNGLDVFSSTFTDNELGIYEASDGGPSMMTDLHVDDCTFTGHGFAAIFVEELQTALVENCTFVDNIYGFYIFKVYNAGVLMSDVTVQDSTFTRTSSAPFTTGIRLWNFTGLDNINITGCTITGMQFGFRLHDTGVGWDTVHINNNNIYGNGHGIASTTPVDWPVGPDAVDAEDNWWGAASGPYDPIGMFEADSPGTCFPPDPDPLLDMLNDDGTGNSAYLGVNGFVDYCPWLLTGPTGRLTLEAVSCQDDVLPGEPGNQIAVELWMRDLPSNVSGFQAFLTYDDGVLDYFGAFSSYTGAPFSLHFTATADAEVLPGELRLDGSDAGGGSGTPDDSHLATLIFTVDSECTATSVDFDLTQDFDSELSYLGLPLPTELVGTGSFVNDDTDPVIDPCPLDIVQAADAGTGSGCDGAVVTFTDPGATDNCGVTVVCDPASGDTFPLGPTTVTCTATDDCGNTDVCTFTVTVTDTNVMSVEIELVGVHIPVSRCIHFVMNDCDATSDTTLSFIDHDGDDLNLNGLIDSTEGLTDDPSTPVRTVGATIEVPCGVWTSLCAKDEQHTKWGSSEVSLSMDMITYVTDTIISLAPGDNDNDGDVDINDVTFLIATFGDLALDGGCPFNPAFRDSDFSNNGAIGSEDYSLFTDNWLTSSSCVCTASFGGPLTTRLSFLSTKEIAPSLARRVDLNRDGFVDYKDVRIFELNNGLPPTLSRKMQITHGGR